jgi:hypothetical protein
MNGHADYAGIMKWLRAALVLSVILLGPSRLVPLRSSIRQRRPVVTGWLGPLSDKQLPVDRGRVWYRIESGHPAGRQRPPQRAVGRSARRAVRGSGSPIRGTDTAGLDHRHFRHLYLPTGRK